MLGLILARHSKFNVFCTCGANLSHSCNGNSLSVAGSSRRCPDAAGGPLPLRSCPNSHSATCGSAPHPPPIGQGMTHDRRRASKHPPVAAVKAVDSPPGIRRQCPLSSPCHDPEIPLNRTRHPPTSRRNPSLAASPCRPSSSSSPLPQPPSHPPYLEADCCIVVVAASRRRRTHRHCRCLHHRHTRVGGGQRSAVQGRR
jgi:hypothetical protein